MIAKILVVDDNENLRESLKAILAEQGHTVLEAADGAQAFTIAEREMPHIILSDVVMPGVYGTTAAKRLNEFYKTADIPIILMSGSIEQSVLGDLLEQPNIRYLKKPVDPEELQRTIKELLPKGGYTP